MLVLRRKVGEKLFIGNVEVEVVCLVDHGRSIYAGNVRLGISAPPTVRIEREELRKERLAREARAKGGGDG